jgi:hypothetical protein
MAKAGAWQKDKISETAIKRSYALQVHPPTAYQFKQNQQAVIFKFCNLPH